MLAPRCLAHASAAVFAILNQKPRPVPKPLRWANSIKREFGHDPLFDPKGKRMEWVRRLRPSILKTIEGHDPQQTKLNLPRLAYAGKDEVYD